MDADRWEHGSEFHWPLAESEALSTDLNGPWRADGVLMGSGRDALRFVLEHGRRTQGWSRLWVPSYMCQHVVETLVETGLSCTTYADAPTRSAPDPASLTPGPDDVVLIVNYFGLRDAASLDSLRLGGAALLVDHTHDPLSSWAHSTEADYAVASLRKTLPIPDGGVVWSPRGHALPDAPALTSRHAAAVDAKWKAMRLKGHYLEGELVAKADFRALWSESEAEIAAGEISGMHPATRARIPGFPVTAWRERRRENHRVLADALGGFEGLDVLEAVDAGCPFSAVVVFDDPTLRERVRQALIQARCYPAVLWPMAAPVLEGVPEAHQALGERMLSIHCDMRYDAADMTRVAAVVCEVLAS